MQTKNINHQHDPQRRRRGTGGVVCTCNHNNEVHQNCQLISSSGKVALPPRDRMYGSTSALYQGPDLTHVNQTPISKNKLSGQSVKSTSNIPKLLTSFRFGANNNRSSFHSLNPSEQTPAQTSGQTTSCTSTPLLSSSALRRQTSLGVLEGQALATGSQAQSCRTSEEGFGAFQQRIRSMLLPAKDSCKGKGNQMNTNDVLAISQASNEGINSTDVMKRSSASYNPMNTYSASNPSIDAFNGLDDENDSFHIRDVCSKWFGHYGQNQSPINQSLSSQMVSVVNKSSLLTDSPKLSHNMKSTLLDKVGPKDSICQNPYTNCLDNQLTIETSISSETHSMDTRLRERQPSVDCDLISLTNDRHVVVVNGLDCSTNRSTCLTVRSDFSPNETLCKSSPILTSANGIQSNSALNPMNVNKVCDGSAESTGSHEHNYKSSSDSGRGTMRLRGADESALISSPEGVSPLDLTSLDSGQSSPGIATSVWVDRSVNQSTELENTANNEKIEKMQRELQRILEDNHSVQSSEVEIDDLSRNFKTRLSVVNESDSWTSNTPSQTPVPPKAVTTPKYCDSKPDVKYSQINSNGLKKSSTKAYNPSKKCSTNEKQLIASNKQIVVNEKHKYPAVKSTKASQMSNSCPKRKINDRLPYNLVKSKLHSNHSHMKSKDRYLVDCDMASTTTARDSTYVDDLSSEYTATTSVCQRDDVFSIRKQLQGLENMYSEILGMVGTRGKTDSNYRRRKVCRSASSVVSGRSSVTSRGTRDLYYRRSKHEFRRHKSDESHSSRRLKRLESHVITLARSVAQLSTDVRYNQSLSQEMESLRQDIDVIRDQLLALKQTVSVNGFGISNKIYHQSNGHNVGNGRRNANHIINPNKVEKLKRFFGDEPPLLRQFLKKLGYEKYARNFEVEKIGITELPYLTEERMMKLGIPLGPRMRIIQESHQQLKSNANADQYSVYAIV